MSNIILACFFQKLRGVPQAIFASCLLHYCIRIPDGPSFDRSNLGNQVAFWALRKKNRFPLFFTLCISECSGNKLFSPRSRLDHHHLSWSNPPKVHPLLSFLHFLLTGFFKSFTDNERNEAWEGNSGSFFLQTCIRLFALFSRFNFYHLPIYIAYTMFLTVQGRDISF